MDKIRLQDLLRFLLPGLLVSLAIPFLFSHVVRLVPKGIRCQDLCSFCDSVMFLLAAFLIGHATQVFGNQFEWRQIPNYRCLAPNRQIRSRGFQKYLSIFGWFSSCTYFFSYFLERCILYTKSRNGLANVPFIEYLSRPLTYLVNRCLSYATQ